MAANERRRDPRTPGKTKKTQPRKTTPEVVYTPARPFHPKKLLLQVLTIIAVAFAIFLGLSIFFKVDTVTVAGCQRYSPASVAEASDIEKGDSLLFFGEAAAASRIVDALPYVNSVRFDVRLPGTVTIIIEEAPTAYAVKDTAGAWWLLTATGSVVESVDSAVAGQYTAITGITLQSPTVGKDAVAAETEPEGSAITGEDRLRTAITILQALEKNELLGVAASVDVSNLQALQLWYGNRFQVKLGNSDNMEYKLAALKSAVEEMSPYQTGVLDVSFTTFPDSVGYMPFTE